MIICFFFFNDTPTTEICTLSLHDARPIFGRAQWDPVKTPTSRRYPGLECVRASSSAMDCACGPRAAAGQIGEHTSELQSRQYLVCRLLLEKKILYIPIIRRCHHSTATATC